MFILLISPFYGWFYKLKYLDNFQQYGIYNREMVFLYRIYLIKKDLWKALLDEKIQVIAK